MFDCITYKNTVHLSIVVIKYTVPGGRIINVCDTRENKPEKKTFQVKTEDVGTAHEKSVTSDYILCAN
jgi:hypothetical protein